ncbi:MAG: (4Fe-4S)-binding protein [Bacteroidales bacterium]|jgi:uncharacterized Fe-S cluster protein YjdI|nr:(4Fe-4S)-binding protein [Bacteroidales bacterium]
MESHKKFSGGRKYSNGEITVYWKPEACVHASYCYRELIEVFDPGRRPWVDMSAASTERIIEVVNMCPTEALSWKWNDEDKNNAIGPEQTNHINFRRPELVNSMQLNQDSDTVSVKIMPDGPVLIKGSFTLLYGGKRKEIKNSIISICRCGASKMLPFCDGHHKIIGFEDK